MKILSLSLPRPRARARARFFVCLFVFDFVCIFVLFCFFFFKTHSLHFNPFLNNHVLLWKLKVLITYPVYSHFLEYDVSRPNIAGLLITFDPEAELVILDDVISRVALDQVVVLVTEVVCGAPSVVHCFSSPTSDPYGFSYPSWMAFIFAMQDFGPLPVYDVIC